MKLLYSSEELQELFRCSRQTISRMENDGRLKRLYNVPGTFYRAADVLALCEYKEPAHGPLEWERLKSENKALSEENRALREKLSRIYEFLREAVKL
ncbi:hypothetical protein ACE418_02910 [Megasphaera sp. WILCCON 0056]|uniref:hypothetical protein n=1 Tax=Megasphaera sp. WILCCON 0056 TaxID=3345340 RepID=UPI003A7F822D